MIEGKPRINRFREQLAGDVCHYIIDNELEAGASLNVVKLARQLNVSRTPITAALRFLADKGIVRSVSQRGFFVSDIGPAQRKYMAGLGRPDVKLYVRIAEDRVSGALRDDVTEAFLMRRYGVERSELIGTLKELEADGLIHSRPGRGWRFEPSLNNPDVYLESYNFRKMLFSGCFFESTYRFDRELANKCRQEHQAFLAPESLSPRTIAAYNSNFYETLARFSGNRFLLMAVEQQNRIRWFQEYAYRWERDPERLGIVYTNHMNILDALEADDRAMAAHLIWLHLDQASKLNPPWAQQI